MPKPLECHACKTVFMIKMQVYSTEGYVVNYPPVLKCGACDTWAIPTLQAKKLKLPVREPDAHYQWYTNVTALTVLRQLQPPPETWADEPAIA